MYPTIRIGLNHRLSIKQRNKMLIFEQSPRCYREVALTVSQYSSTQSVIRKQIVSKWYRYHASVGQSSASVSIVTVHRSYGYTHLAGLWKHRFE